MVKDKRVLMISLFLAAATLAAFWQVSRCEFINIDDTEYVTQNSHIQNGITMEGIRWAFTTQHASNWHPLTWLSHMLDVQLFGLNARGHHLTNLFFHIANTLLLFLVFHRMTKEIWQSAFVAALFALHPLHVESVAWVAERKDVLSTFFWMLTLGAYLWYAERPGLPRYLSVVLFFALGLTAKPMLVTLPFVLLLLDFWPLHRFEQMKPAPGSRPGAREPAPEERGKGKSKKKRAVKDAVESAQPAKTAPAEPAYSWALIRPLLWEKIPLFALTLLSIVVTYIVQLQAGSVKSIEAYPLGVRISNAIVSYIFYIAKMIWPNDLAVLYPHPGFGPLWQVAGAALLLVAATFMAIRGAKRFPYLPVGWLWYVGTLVPVIGLVQVGIHARADRYSYVPLIGLFIITAWGIPDLLKGWRHRKEAIAALSALSLACLFTVTWTQVGYWRNSITLFDHTLNVTDHNSLILNNRGSVYSRLGHYTRAIEDFSRAIEIDPKDTVAYYNRGVAYFGLGNVKPAIDDFSRAIDLNPIYAEYYYNRATAYTRLGETNQAMVDFNRAIEINPKFDDAYFNRGLIHARRGDYSQALVDFDRAIELNPRIAETYYTRGIVRARLGDFRQAIEDFNRSIEINPNSAKAYYSRGAAHNSLGNRRQASEDLKSAARLGHEDARNLLKRHGVN
jgi:tetratricopeptide (TPR) repeat protein